jgi:hypothetical protein
VLQARGPTVRVAPSSSALEVLLRALRGLCGKIWFFIILQGIAPIPPGKEAGLLARSRTIACFAMSLPVNPMASA